MPSSYHVPDACGCPAAGCAHVYRNDDAPMAFMLYQVWLACAAVADGREPADLLAFNLFEHRPPDIQAQLFRFLERRGGVAPLGVSQKQFEKAYHSCYNHST